METEVLKESLDHFLLSRNPVGDLESQGELEVRKFGYICIRGDELVSFPNWGA